VQRLGPAPAAALTGRSGRQPSDNPAQIVENDPKRTRQMIRLADGVVFDYVVPIFNMVTSTAKDSNGA
jgi:hypothetical protein